MSSLKAIVFILCILVTILILNIIGCSDKRISNSNYGICLPHGVESLPHPSEIVSALNVMTDYGPGFFVTYQTSNHTVQIIWFNSLPIAIDSEAEKPVGPVWVRESLDECTWKQVILGGVQI
mgnify:CR=1 FL=1